MTVLVTGGAGYIGSHVLLALAAHGEKVVVLDDLSTGRREAVSHGELVVGDVGDRALLDKLFSSHSIESVMHFAGSIVPSESLRRPLDYYQNNTAAALTLMRACVAHGVRRFVFSSSAAVYAEPPTGVCAEDSPLAPPTPYGKSKAMTEAMLVDAALSGELDAVSLRYFNVAGADPQARTGNAHPQAIGLFPALCRVAMGVDQAFRLNGNDYATPDGTCIRDYIHVSDLAEAHVHALAHLRAGKGSRVFNCGYGRGHSVQEVVEAFNRALPRPLPVVVGVRRPGDLPHVVADNQAILRETAWRPRHDSLDEMVLTSLGWARRGRP